jgi:uncharacterized protein (TIRG00374 family)
MLKKHFVKIFLGIFFSSAFIYLTLRQIDFKVFVELLKTADYAILTLSGFIYVLCYIFRSIRYYFIILPLKKTKVFENFPYTVIGFFANNIIPLRIGELIRAKITGERLGISRSSVFATIVIERIFDIAMFVILFFTTMVFMPFPEFVKKTFYILTAISAVCFFMFFIILSHEEKTLKILMKLPVPDSAKLAISGFFNKFTDGLAILNKPSVLIKTFIMSAVVWAAESLFFFIVAYSCGVKISIWGAVFTVIIIGVGVIIPTAPGYLGAFEFMGVTALQTLSIDKSAAFACVALYHFLEIVLIFALGFFCILKSKLSVSDLFKFSTIEADNNDKRI